MPTRRRILQAAAALALPSVARGAGDAGADSGAAGGSGGARSGVDDAYQTRDHGFLVFDTLFGLDSRFRPRRRWPRARSARRTAKPGGSRYVTD